MNAVFYGFAIVITVLVQTIQGQLDLYHAVFVVHLLACLSGFQVYGMTCIPLGIYRVLIREENTGMFRFVSAPRFDLKLKITLAVQLCQFLLIFPVWSLYVWIKDSRFGPQPECNHLVKYVIVFVSVRATINWLRILTITMLSLSIFTCLLGSPAVSSLLKTVMKTKPDEDKAQDEGTDVEFGSLSMFTSVSSFWWARSRFPRNFYFTITCHPVLHSILSCTLS